MLPLVVTDLDLVLVDSRAAHFEAAALAAGAYLEEICGIRDGHRLATAEHTAILDAAIEPDHPAGLAWAFTYFFLAQLPSILRPRPSRPKRVREVTHAFANQDLRYGELTGFAELKLEPLRDAVQERGGGLAGLRGSLGHDVMESWILFGGEIGVTERLRQLESEDDPDLDEVKRLKACSEDGLGRLYQEFWLGSARFEEVYGIPASGDRGDGLILREQPQVEAAAVRALSEVADLVVATLRSHRETMLTLERLELAASITTTAHAIEGEERNFDVPRAWPVPRALAAHGGDRPAIFVLSGRPQHLAQTQEVDLRTVLATDEPPWLRPLGYAWCREVRRRLEEAGAEAVISRLTTLQRAATKAVDDDAPDGAPERGRLP